MDMQKAMPYILGVIVIAAVVGFSIMTYTSQQKAHKVSKDVTTLQKQLKGIDCSSGTCMISGPVQITGTPTADTALLFVNATGDAGAAIHTKHGSNGLFAEEASTYGVQVLGGKHNGIYIHDVDGPAINTYKTGPIIGTVKGS